MGDGKALQMGTSHELGQNFAKAFGIQYSSDTGNLEYVWQTSWGVSTRLVGALIMAHGDDAGLRLPPLLAPIQVVVIVVRGEGGAAEAAAALADELRADGLRVKVDDRFETSFGRRSVDWEIKGVPIRLEVGPRDIANGMVTLVRRDTQEKVSLPVTAARAEVAVAMAAVQTRLLAEATQHQSERTVEVATRADALEAAGRGFALIAWDDLGEAGELELATRGISVRCLRRRDGGLAGADDEPGLVAVVARSY